MLLDVLAAVRCLACPFLEPLNLAAFLASLVCVYGCHLGKTLHTLRCKRHEHDKELEQSFAVHTASIDNHAGALLIRYAIVPLARMSCVSQLRQTFDRSEPQ